MSDLRLELHGSLNLVHPLTEAGTEWLDEHVDDDATYFGAALVVEPRYTADLLYGAVADGLAISGGY